MVRSVVTTQLKHPVHFQFAVVWKIKSLEKVIKCIEKWIYETEWITNTAWKPFNILDQSAYLSVRNRIQHDIHDQCFMWTFHFVQFSRNYEQTQKHTIVSCLYQ